MRIEQVIELNDVGAANGEVRLYTHGQLRTTRTNLELRTAEHPRGYYHIHFAPVWGGSCGSTRCPKLVDNWMRIGPVHIAGVLEG